MKQYICSKTPDLSSPLKVFGLPPYFDGEGFSKLHKAITDKITRIEMFGHRSCGGRICFKTNAKKFTIITKIEAVRFDIGMSVFSGSSLDVYAGERKNARFLGLLNPPAQSDAEVTVEREFNKHNDEMEDITVFLPRNETITYFELRIDDKYDVEEPTPYINKKPVIFYGSSIVEGGCPTRVGCNYVSMLSNRMNIDILNYGFSGNARGNLDIAEYIFDKNPCVFVFDYDHNAPDTEHLRNTHEPFFKKIREAFPNIPIIMMSMPDFGFYTDTDERRSIIKATYENAVNSGDRLVSFIDGREYFPKEVLYDCTVDATHPNDMGFHYMALRIQMELEKYIEYIK